MFGRVAAIERNIDQFQKRVQTLAVRHGIKLDPDDQRQLAAAADELIKRLDETQTSVSNRERAKEREKESRQLSERQEQRLNQVGLEIENLLAAGGAADPEEFRRRVRLHEDRQELERRRDEHLRSLERLSGPGGQFQAFRESLTAADPNRLREESGRLLEQATEADAGRNKLLEERGGIDARLAQLTGEEESSALRIRRNTLLEQLQEQARRWSRLTIAESLLEKTEAQVRAGTPAQRHPPRPGLLFHRNRQEVHWAVRAPWGADDIGDGRHRRQQAALGTEPRHPGATLLGAAFRPDSGVRRTRGAAAGRRRRGAGQLRPRAG